jgi:hypothetical protein
MIEGTEKQLKPMEDVTKRLCALEVLATEAARVVRARVGDLVGETPDPGADAEAQAPPSYSLQCRMIDSIKSVSQSLENIRDEINRF